MSDEGGDDSPPRPKRKIKRVVLLSSSDSENDENIGVAQTRRKRLRVVSDEEASNSSGSSIVCAGTRRRRMLPRLRDSEAESDSSGWASDHSRDQKTIPSTAKPTSGFASDSSEGNSDKCSICLLRFTNQEVGTPESCEHIFCLDCIMEWSKNMNTCPVDRITFNSIVVKACLGGRVLRTQPVQVIERRPSVDLFVIEDPTVCEICGTTDGEETMLLCDGCDLGYHMQCLTPPLSEVPADQWLCPNCYTDILSEDDLIQNINLSEVEDLLDDIMDTSLPRGPRPSVLRQQRSLRRSSRNVNVSDQPSTSTGRRSTNVNINDSPSTSRGTRSTQRSTSLATSRRPITKLRRKYKRRRTKTVVIEYELEENGKFPISKRVTRRVKKRRVKKRQPRTAARRSHVRASVRARLASLNTNQAQGSAQVFTARANGQELSVRRHRAGIPSLSLLGNPNEFDYFSDLDDAISEEASTAVAVRPTANILSAYRQARRKMITIPSPPHASSAPDILSNILESQTLLHAKKSVVSITVDGNVNIKLQSNRQKNNIIESNKDEKLDLTRTDESVKNVPSYPGQNRGGGWGGGYRGNYHREQTSNNFNRGGNHDSSYGGGYQNRQGNSYNYQNNNMRREDSEYYDNFPQRNQQYSHTDDRDTFFDRSRRPNPLDGNRGPGTTFPNQRSNDQNQSRYSLGPSWQPYNTGGGPSVRQEIPQVQHRHSFGGFENPVDMRMGQIPAVSANVDRFSGVEAPRQEKTQPPVYQQLPEPKAYQPLSQPPVFNFPKISEVEKSEDEKSDSSLVIDTEKYDPTEPTNDDDSGEEEKVEKIVVPSPPPAAPLPPPPPPPPPAMQSILAGLDASAMNVPPNILDTAVRQVLKEHRNLIVPPSSEPHNNRSDDESDGDCPNFSIYSATSVHIANNSVSLSEEVAKEQPEDSLEDLVQEDDETPPSTSPVVRDTEIKPNIEKTIIKTQYNSTEYEERKKSDEEYKEKISKRCPITTNTRNPIKIKLHTPSLIKRHVSLYDEEETSQDAEVEEKTESTANLSGEKVKVVENIISKKEVKKNVDKEISSMVNKQKSVSPLKETVDNKNKEFRREEESKIHTEENVEEPVIDSNVDNNKKDVKDDDINTKNKMIVDNDKEENYTESLENTIEMNDEEDHIDNVSDQELCLDSHSPKPDRERETLDKNIEKMTESISETEDERSYTPCLDENKSNKDASFEIEKEKGIEGLDTEMISEEEGNEMFSENERPPSETFRTSPLPPAVKSQERASELSEKKKESKKSNEGGKKKKKKDSKKESKEKSKSKKKNEIAFKKLSKSGKERNYRERDKDEKVDKERRDSGDAAESRQRRRKEKRKDLERYDVRTVVTEKRKKQKDPFGRDVSPRGRSPSPSPPPRSPSRRSPSPRRSLSRVRISPSRGTRRRTPSRSHRSPSRPRKSPSRVRRSPSASRRSTSRGRRSPSRIRRSFSRGRRSLSRIRRSASPLRRSASRGRRSPFVRRSISRRGSPPRGRSPTPARLRRSPVRLRRSASSVRRRSGTPHGSPRRRTPPRRKRRRSGSRVARRRSAAASPPRRPPKKKKRARSPRRALPSPARPVAPELPSPASRPPSPRTPPPEPEPEPEPERRERRRRDPDRQRRRGRDAVGPSKEVFTSGDNILVSVSFKEQERGEEGERRRRRETRREKRRRRRTTAAVDETAKPVAIIDLERSPFRELTPSPKNVIVLSDSEPGEREGVEAAPPAAAPEPAPEAPPPALGPKTPPEPVAPEPVAVAPAERPESQSAGGGSEPPSPDAYDPFEPTRSPSASPEQPEPGPIGPSAAASPPRATITLEAAQRSNLSADEVLDRRPLTPVEKVLALLQSTREAEAESEAPEPLPAPRIVLPSPTRVPPKLFPGKPSPIKSNPVKPMQAARLPRPPSEGGASPYSPGSSDFGELFEPPPRRPRMPRPPARHDRKRGKTQVGVKIDDEHFKILDELPSSAVELQVKSKFLKKLNRQERVVEEVKLVLKPHYNKKHVTKEEYKDILRRAVPKICHNKSGEINPTKIQALVEAYVKKFRKKHKLGVA